MLNLLNYIVIAWIFFSATTSIGAFEIPQGATSPPTVKVKKKFPKLVNYFHRMDLRESGVGDKNREAYLAQWDVIILNPDNAKYQKLDLDKIRTVNKDIKILIWVTTGEPWAQWNDLFANLIQPEGRFVSGSSIQTANEIRSRLNVLKRWYSRSTKNEEIIFFTGRARIEDKEVQVPLHNMNLFSDDMAWGNYLARFVSDYYLQAPTEALNSKVPYDGVMFDFMNANPFCNDTASNNDVNRDGVRNHEDLHSHRLGMTSLLRQVREKHPDAIITGNSGLPLSDEQEHPKETRYRLYANGCLHENALGGQFGGDWHVMWDGIMAMEKSRTNYPHRPYHFIIVDVRNSYRSYEDAFSLRSLTKGDLRRMRLGLATSMLIDDVYFGFDR